jgi:hypothetical protein
MKYKCSKCRRTGHNKATCGRKKRKTVRKKKRVTKKKTARKKKKTVRKKKKTVRKKKRTTKKKTARKKPVRKKKKRVTKKKTTRKTTSKVRGYLLNASYSSKKHGWGALDGKIARAAKKRAIGSGTMLSTGWRDVDFQFKTKEAANKAKTRIKKIKGVRVKIWPIRD